VPMHLRRDALAAAAECVLAVELIAGSDHELVGTVGKIEASPGAINVIPGRVRFSVDVRAPTDQQRERALDARFPQLLALKCFGGNFPPISKILRAILAFLVCALLIDGLV